MPTRFGGVESALANKMQLTPIDTSWHPPSSGSSTSCLRQSSTLLYVQSSSYWNWWWGITLSASHCFTWASQHFFAFCYCFLDECESPEDELLNRLLRAHSSWGMDVTLRWTGLHIVIAAEEWAMLWTSLHPSFTACLALQILHLIWSMPKWLWCLSHLHDIEHTLSWNKSEVCPYFWLRKISFTKARWSEPLKSTVLALEVCFFKTPSVFPITLWNAFRFK